jgi:hypothetical protein
MKKTLLIFTITVLILIVLMITYFVIWKREPWVKTYHNRQECESSTGKECVIWQCDLVMTTYWLDCPHGSGYFAPIK